MRGEYCNEMKTLVFVGGREHLLRAPITVHFGRLWAGPGNADSLTHFGGLFLIQRFCHKLRLRRRLERILQPTPVWSDYHPADLILVFLYVMIAGLPRVSKTEMLRYNGLFLALAGLERFPDPTALRRFL